MCTEDKQTKQSIHNQIDSPHVLQSSRILTCVGGYGIFSDKGLTYGESCTSFNNHWKSKKNLPKFLS